MDSNIDTIQEKLSTILSIIILLENDCEVNNSDEIQFNTLKVAHKLLRELQEDLVKISLVN